MSLQFQCWQLFFFFLTCKAIFDWSTHHVGGTDLVGRFLVVSCFLDIGQKALCASSPSCARLPCDAIPTQAKLDGGSL